MRIRPAELWRVSGTVDRGVYALVGVIGFAIKHNVDRFIASAFFHRPWSVFNYWAPLGKAMQLGALSPDEARFCVAMVTAALPFIWVGVALTIKRLRSTRLPLWLVLLFFAPFINLVLFLLLSLLPARAEKPPVVEQDAQPLGLIPDHPVGSAAMVLLLTLLGGIAAVQLSTRALSKYGWGLFVALPFCLGLASSLLYGYRRPRTLGSCVCVAATATLLLGIALLAFAIEGVFCIAMAAPIGLGLAALGAFVGYVIQQCRWSKDETASMLLALFVAVPLLMGAEAMSPLEAPLFAVRTSVDVDAVPERVWRRVVSFPELPAPQEWLFRAGIAYPMRAEILGQGAGAIRHCIFSTGTFIEPIQVWDEPRLLRFAVVENPPPMQEWTPYATIHPPHLSGFLLSRQGQFLLTPLPGGRTRLEGTTWYRHNMWPASYWRLWSDFMMHRIHLRVLNHIKRLAESNGSESQGLVSVINVCQYREHLLCRGLSMDSDL